jgi:protein-disulfide isomerase
VLSLAAIAAGIFLVVWGGGDESDSLVPANAHSLGQPDAPLTLVEFADFQCPFCRAFATTQARQLKEELVASGQVRFVYRHLAFLGEESVQAAEASECASDQGRFWEFHDKLFDNWNGENQGAFADANLKQFAGGLGLDKSKFDRCLDSGKYEKFVQAERRAGNRLGVRSTPTLFFNGQMFRGMPRDYEVLKLLVDMALRGETLPS